MSISSNDEEERKFYEWISKRTRISLNYLVKNGYFSHSFCHSTFFIENGKTVTVTVIYPSNLTNENASYYRQVIAIYKNG